MTCVRTDSFALSELCAFVIGTQGPAKPAPWAKFSHAFGAPSASGNLDAPARLPAIASRIRRSRSDTPDRGFTL